MMRLKVESSAPCLVNPFFKFGGHAQRSNSQLTRERGLGKQKNKNKKPDLHDFFAPCWAVREHALFSPDGTSSFSLEMTE